MSEFPGAHSLLKAEEVVELFQAGSEDGGSLTSPRGSVVVDVIAPS